MNDEVITACLARIAEACERIADALETPTRDLITAMVAAASSADSEIRAESCVAFADEVADLLGAAAEEDTERGSDT